MTFVPNNTLITPTPTLDESQRHRRILITPNSGAGLTPLPLAHRCHRRLTRLPQWESLDGIPIPDNR